MPRPTRLFLPGQTHHVIQRGNNRGAVFFEDADRALYLSGLGEAARSLDCAVHKEKGQSRLFRQLPVSWNRLRRPFLDISHESKIRRIIGSTGTVSEIGLC